MTAIPATTLTFLGGAESVTGSKYLLQLGNRRVLVDAGMFQGEKELRLRNWDDFPVDPASITDILLTHAHLDHVGYLPRLVKLGFQGTVWATVNTIKLAELVLLDSAHLQELDAENALKRGYSKHETPEPLYRTVDVEHTMPLFRSVDFGVDTDLGDGLIVRFSRAGHILGSASIHITTPDGTVVFSGDLGRHDHPVLRPREVPAGAPFVLVESTYGDREHPEWHETPHEDFAEAIRRTVKRGGSILIPAFAVDRTEILLVTLNDMKQAGRIPDIPIFLDSPMGLRALDIYQDSDRAGELNQKLDPADLVNVPNLHEATTVEESIRLNDPRTPCIIISSSGMATGGRVVHHLQYMLPNPKHTIVFTGYQAIGTRGRSLVDGETKLKMYGQYIPVRAEVMMDDGFSTHADASDLLDWLKALDPQPQTVFCVHGEEGAPVLAKRIEDELGITAVVPRYKEKISLTSLN